MIAGDGDLLLVTVAVAEEEYGVPVERVREVVAWRRPQPLPRAERHVLGVIDLRGQLVPVVSARASFGLPEIAPTIDTCIVIVETPDGAAGLAVDAVREVMTTTWDRALPPPPSAGEAVAEAVASVVRLEDRLLVVLDVDAVLGPLPTSVPVAAPHPDHDPEVAPEPEEGAEEEPGPDAEPAPEPEAAPEPEPEPEPEDEPEPTAEPEQVEEPEPEPSEAEPDEPETPTAEFELPPFEEGAPADGDGGLAARDAEIVREVHALLEQHAERAGDAFAEDLLRSAPGLHARLGLDQRLARRRVLAGVGLAVRGADRPEEVVPALERIGVPVGGASEDECAVALAASLRTLERGLGSRFTPEMRAAWERTGERLLGAVFLGRPPGA